MSKKIEYERKGTAIQTRPIYGPKDKDSFGTKVAEFVGACIAIVVVGAIILAIL